MPSPNRTVYDQPPQAYPAVLGECERWYVAHALPMCELRAQAHLENQLMAGAFPEQLAILESMGDAGRVRVLLYILGRKVSIATHSNNFLPLA